MLIGIPNLITIGRILLVPLTIWLLLTGAHVLALGAFLLAGASDAVDGFLARRLSQTTELGAYLDPLADKALLVSIYVVLAFMNVLPAWLAILVVTRDILIVGAVVLARIMDRPLEMKPLFISKANTLAQIMFAGLLLFVLASELDLGKLLIAGSMAVAALTLASGALYMRDWIRHMAHSEEGQKPK